MSEGEKLEKESKRIPRSVGVMLASIVIFLGGATVGEIDLRYSDNKVPESAIRLPGSNKNVANYLVPKNQADQVRCGKPITWLPAGIFDLDQQRERLTPQQYKYDRSVTAADLALVAKYANDQYEIISCVETYGI